MNLNLAKTAVVILAAGDGKRMKSAHSKVCCEVLFKPMISWVLSGCERLGLTKQDICVVVSDIDNGVRGLLPEDVVVTEQEKKLGTGHAVMQALPFLRQKKNENFKNVCVLYGDVPFLDEKVLAPALCFHEKNNNAVTVLTSVVDDPSGYGRIIHEDDGNIKIIESADATAEELFIHEINSGVYCFDLDFLIKALPKLTNNNVQKEFYLTDTVAMAKDFGLKSDSFACKDASAVLGANSRKDLASLNEIARQKVFDKLYEQGVNIPCTDGIIISPDTDIAPDTTILPGCILTGHNIIGSNCVIGPNSQINDSTIGDGSIINASKIDKSIIKNNVKIGPFSQLRPDCVIEDNVKIGDFVEVKNSVVGEKTSLAHLTYIGDSDFGKGINVGCGVVTVNYDGQNKFRTTVEDGAFIGCNTNLIAPVKVGKGAYIAAATTITKDVGDESLVFGRVRQEEKPNGAVGRIKKKI